MLNENKETSITIEDLDKAREAYGDGYDEELEIDDREDYFDIPVIFSHRYFD